MKSFLIDIDNVDLVAKGIATKHKELSACLGNFNGIHLGHQMLLRDAKIDARYPLAVISFSSPLGEYNIENKDKELLLSNVQKEVQLNKLGVRYNIEIKLSEDFLELSPEVFINLFLLKLGVKEVFVGEDYHFGKDRKGDVNLLEKYFDVHKKTIYTYQGDKISTSDIIREIKAGNIALANHLLGRPFEMNGKVVEGLHNGKRIGFPTINLEPSVNYPLPKFGVYEVVCYILGIPYRGVANIGVHPTLDKLDKPSIEIHLLNFDKDVYGKTIYVEFLSKIRDEKEFENEEELAKQIELDIKSIKK